MREVLVWPKVHNTLWQTLDKVLYDKVWDRLISQLENNYDSLRTQRNPEDETLFNVTLFFPSGETWHKLEFHVDDTMADTNLFVVDVIHTERTIGIG